MDRKILFIVTNHADLGSSKAGVTGWYLPELCHPYDVLEKAGFTTIDFASPCGGPSPVDKSSLSDFAKDAICTRVYWRDDVKTRLQNTLKIASVDFNAYEAVFIVGGHGPMWDLPNCKCLADQLAHFYSHNGLIAAICHGPCALVNVFVEGRPVSCQWPRQCLARAPLSAPLGCHAHMSLRLHAAGRRQTHHELHERECVCRGPLANALQSPRATVPCPTTCRRKRRRKS